MFPWTGTRLFPFGDGIVDLVFDNVVLRDDFQLQASLFGKEVSKRARVKTEHAQSCSWMESFFSLQNLVVGAPVTEQLI